ncbi:toprim domain-containing protein, partial [Heliobacterium chlorum]
MPAKAYLVESEIDAMTLWQMDCPAIAIGGANLSERQRTLLLQSPIQHVILATDNDLAGQRIAQSVWQQLNGYLSITQLQLPEHVKDVNELSRTELEWVIQKEKNLLIWNSVLHPNI